MSPDDVQHFAEVHVTDLEGLGERRTPTQAPKAGVPVGALGWLAATYFVSVEFTGLPAISRRTRRGIIEDCLREPLKPGSNDKIALFSALHIKMLRDRQEREEGRSEWLKYLSSMFSWAIARNPPLLRSNPARDVKPKQDAEGFHSWTTDDVKQFEVHDRIGTKPRLAFAPMYCLGVRRSDVVLLGRQHLRNATMRLVQAKTRHRRWTRSNSRFVGTPRDHRGPRPRPQ